VRRFFFSGVRRKGGKNTVACRRQVARRLLPESAFTASQLLP
jgi:hypothetical protein